MNEYQRHGIDHDPVKPWNWATMPFRDDPVEIVSYPDMSEQSVVVRMTVGDPTSIRTVPLKSIAAFAPDRHEWSQRHREYYNDNPTAFVFTDAESLPCVFCGMPLDGSYCPSCRR